ncbi:hypothetical protein [Treponema denticola]
MLSGESNFYAYVKDTNTWFDILDCLLHIYITQFQEKYIIQEV